MSRTIDLGYSDEKFQIGNEVFGVSLSPDGLRVAAGSFDRLVRLISVETGKVERILHGHRDIVYSVAFSPDGTMLASCGCDGVVYVWDVETGKQRLTLSGHLSYVRSVAFSPNGKFLVSGGGDVHADPPTTEIKLWDVETGSLISSFRGQQCPVHTVAFHRQGTIIASGGGNPYANRGEIILWDAISYQPIRHLNGHRNVVKSVVFPPDGGVSFLEAWTRL